MKKSILLIAATFSLTVASMAQVPSYVPSNGLVGWWPFNGNANDESGYKNHGIINSAMPSKDRFGISNSSYYFNGTSTVNIKNKIQYNFGKDSNFSVNIWFKRFSVNNTWRVFLSYACPNFKGVGGFQLGTTTNMNLELGSTVAETYTNGKVNDTSWHMLTINVNRILDSVYVYQDAAYLGKIAIKSSHSYTPACLPDLVVGGERNFWTQNYFIGNIDDIGIWNRALSQKEISDLYNGNICYQLVSVTDTLLINMGMTGFNPVTYANTIKIYPNPSNDHITIDYGDLSSLKGYQIIIKNSIGQQMFQSAITQQTSYINLSSWTGKGLYFVHILDGQGATIDIRKIVLR